MQIPESGPPGCSDDDVVGLIEEMLQEEAQVGALLFGGESFGYSRLLLALDPMVAVKMDMGDFGEAFAMLESAVNTLPETSGEEGFLSPKFLKKAVSTAKQSQFEISALSTMRRTEYRSYCSFSVTMNYGWHLEDMGLSDDQKARLVSLAGALRLDRKFETYYSDDGDVYVELERPE